MAKQLPNQFSTYQFDSPEEELSSLIYTQSNIQQLQNRLAAATLERAHLEYDINYPHKFIQQEAALLGEIRTYQTLIDGHFSALDSRSSFISPLPTL